MPGTPKKQKKSPAGIDHLTSVDPAGPKAVTGPTSESSSYVRVVELLLAATGLYASFLTWGYMQEKITGNDYTNDVGETSRWTSSFVLNFSMASAAVILAWVAFQVP